MLAVTGVVLPAMWNAAFYGDLDVRAVPWLKGSDLHSGVATYCYYGSEIKTTVLMFSVRSISIYALQTLNLNMLRKMCTSHISTENSVQSKTLWSSSTA